MVVTKSKTLLSFFCYLKICASSFLIGFILFMNGLFMTNQKVDDVQY